MVGFAAFTMSESKKITIADISAPIWTKEMGYRLRIVREQSRLSQTALAQLLNVTQEDIWRVETGKKKHLNVSVRRWREIFGPRASYLFFGDPEAEARREASLVAAGYKAKPTESGNVSGGKTDEKPIRKYLNIYNYKRITKK